MLRDDSGNLRQLHDWLGNRPPEERGNEHGGKQYVAVLSGVGGWAGIGLAAGLLQPENAAAWHDAVDQGKLPTKDKTVDTAGLGAVGGYAGLASYTSLGGTLTVFALPSQ